jgi:hypothetical protein
MSQHRYTDLFSATHLIDPTQVRFTLTSSPVFLRLDTATDTEHFYNSVLDLFEDPDERGEVNDLLVWWNRYDSALHLHCSVLTGYSVVKANIPYLFFCPVPSLQKQCIGEDQGKACGAEGPSC